MGEGGDIKDALWKIGEHSGKNVGFFKIIG